MSAKTIPAATTKIVNKTWEGRISDPNVNNKSYVNRGGFEYIVNSMMLISVVGMCVKIFFSAEPSSDGTYGPANAVIYGYGIVALAILTIIFISYAIHDQIGNIERKGRPGNILEFLKSFLSSSAPSIFVIIELLWIITLNTSYYTKINKGMVAEEYYQLSKSTSFLVVCQIICLFQYLKLYIQIKADPKNAGEDAVTTQSRIAFVTYLLTVINLIVIGMMTIILEFFSTDG